MTSNQLSLQNFNHKRIHKIKEMVKIIPEKYIVFQCEDDEPMGEIRITTISNPNSCFELPQLEFQLMCTNKENYKVSTSKGKIKKDQATHLIQIYIKNIDNLEKCLSDKFRIRIYQSTNPNNVIIVAKMKVLIEKHKQNLKIEDINNNITQTVSRTASVYTNPSLYMNPSIYMNPSAMSSTAASDIKSVVYFSRILANEQKKISPLQQRQQTLSDYKMEYDESNQKYYNKQKQLKTAQNNFQKNKAKQKLCFGLLIVVFLVSILFGFVVKRVLKSQIWHNLYEHVKNQYFN